MAKHHQKVSRSQLIEMHGRLQQSVKRLDNGYCEYLDGHSDKTVADAMGVSINSVSGARLELFGKLKSATGGVDVSGLRADVEVLEGSLAKLREENAVLRDRFNKLVMTLKLNKVADVAHLAVPT